MMNHDPYNEERIPKTDVYDFVPFTGEPRREKPRGHEKLENGLLSGRLTYRLQVRTLLFVGTGSYVLSEDLGLPAGDVVRPFYRVDGVATVPGSSLKGVIRSHAEAVSRSCITVTRVRRDLLPRGVSISTDNRGCAPESACPACRLFGRMGWAAQVQVGDARLMEGGRTALFPMASLYMPRAFRLPPYYLDDEGRWKGRKFYLHSRPNANPDQPMVEVIPQRGALEGWLDFENLTLGELGLLFFSLGLDQNRRLTLKLGGGKPLGLGSVAVGVRALSLRSGADFMHAASQEERYTGQSLVEWLGKALAEADRSGLILSEPADRLAELLAYPTERQAPTGMY